MTLIFGLKVLARSFFDIYVVSYLNQNGSCHCLIRSPRIVWRESSRHWLLLHWAARTGLKGVLAAAHIILKAPMMRLEGRWNQRKDTFVHILTPLDFIFIPPIPCKYKYKYLLFCRIMYISLYICIYTYIYIHAHIYLDAHTHINMYIYMYINILLYTYIYI